MKINLDLSKIEDSYTRDIFRQVLDYVGSPKGQESVLMYMLSRQVNGEVLTAKTGSPVVSILKHKPLAGTEVVYRNGLRVIRGKGQDYTINYQAGVITFEYNLSAADKIVVDYVK